MWEAFLLPPDEGLLRWASDRHARALLTRERPCELVPEHLRPGVTRAQGEFILPLVERGNPSDLLPNQLFAPRENAVQALVVGSIRPHHLGDLAAVLRSHRHAEFGSVEVLPAARR